MAVSRALAFERCVLYVSSNGRWQRWRCNVSPDLRVELDRAEQQYWTYPNDHPPFYPEQEQPAYPNNHPPFDVR